MNPKQRAAEAALDYVASGMVIGLGTGSTADFFLQALGAALHDGRLRDIRGVPTSRQSERRANELRIPLATLVECPRLDVTIDGADEVTPDLNLIKGLGGALVREKIVAQNSSKLVIIADEGKCVAKLGTRSALPIEVIPFAHEAQDKFLRSLGASPLLRRAPDGSPFISDNANFIYDCKFAHGIDDPATLETALLHRAGILDSGLFLQMATTALIASDTNLKTLQRSPTYPSRPTPQP